MVFLVKTTQSVHYYRIQNICISFDSNSHLKNIVLIFWIKLEKKMRISFLIKFSIFALIQNKNIECNYEIQDIEIRIDSNFDISLSLSKKERKKTCSL